MSKPSEPSECCGATDNPRETWCHGCHEQVCTSCAASWDEDGGYGEDGQQVRVFAFCKECEAEREEKRQRREARNDSGV